MCIRIETTNVEAIINTIIPTGGIDGFSKEQIQASSPELWTHTDGGFEILGLFPGEKGVDAYSFFFWSDERKWTSSYNGTMSL